MNDEWLLGWTDVAIEEFLHHPNIFRPIEATTTDRSKNGTHLKLLSMWRCGVDVAVRGWASRVRRCVPIARRSTATAQPVMLSLASRSYWCYNALHKCILQPFSTVGRINGIIR